MEKEKHTSVFRVSSLNTLAQNETDHQCNMLRPNTTIITGHGSELGTDKVLKGRAKRKLISQTMALNMIGIAEQKENLYKKKAFWNTYHCQRMIYSVGGRYYGKYCKNRHCLLCCSIRKADIINRYYPTMQTWEEPYFITLTVKAIKKERLREVMMAMIRGFRKIISKYRKRNQRGGAIRFVGIKSLECNFNFIRRTYNPHYHIIVANKQIAEILVKEWLLLWTSNWAVKSAQKIRKVENLERDLIETIKYGSKIFTEPDVTQKSKAKMDRIVYAAALYNIFDAMKGLRIFERFGFNLPSNVKRQPTKARVVNEFYEWIFDARYFDWLNSENELMLTAYLPPESLINLLANEIDIVSE